MQVGIKNQRNLAQLNSFSLSVSFNVSFNSLIMSAFDHLKVYLLKKRKWK